MFVCRVSFFFEFVFFYVKKNLNYEFFRFDILKRKVVDLVVVGVGLVGLVVV